MKLSIVVQDMLCQEQVMSGHTTYHKSFVVEVPDELFPKEVLDAYHEMYGGVHSPDTVISQIYTHAPNH